MTYITKSDIITMPNKSREVIITQSIQRYREQRGISQADLALAAKVSQGSISMYENGERTPSLQVLVRIAAALNCTVDDLIEKESA